MPTLNAASLMLFGIPVLILLCADLHLHKSNKPPSFVNAAGWSAVWVTLAFAFSDYVGYRFGTENAWLFITGYLLEQSLSVDNLFVFMAVFASFGIADAFHHRILYYGIAHRRGSIDIRHPGPDSANFPNSANTLPRGRFYIENSPASLFFGTRDVATEYQWQFLIRYGWTDRIEIRVFSNGLTVRKGIDPATGFSPLAFDTKVHLWDRKKKRFIPSVGVEIYIQRDLGSQAFDSGIFPSVNLLFDHTLPGEITFEYNLGTTREQTLSGPAYLLSFPWSFTREIVKDVDLFVQGFHGSPTLPRSQSVTALTRPTADAVGAGALWTVNSRVAVWSSYTFGTRQRSPDLINLGLAVAF